MLSSLATDRAQLADLDAQISDLRFEHSLPALRSQKQLVQERLYSYKYPVLTLPNEIIAEIFIHFLPIYPLCPPLTGPYSPTLLTQICREWQEIAVATPGLWRSLSFDTESLVPLTQQRHICHNWLTRSRSCPLSIEFGDSDMPLALAAGIAHRVRWEYLKLTLSRSYLPVIDGPMPLLRHLDLTLDDGLDVTTKFPEAPLFRSLTLYYFAASSKVVLPWAQLTSVTLHSIYRHEYVAALRQASRLVHCELNISFDEEDSSTEAPLEHGIDLLHLESLALSPTPLSLPWLGWLQDFITPALRSLRVAEKSLMPEPVDTLSSFISKSGCKLQKLRVTGTRTVSKGSYRKAFPSIQLSFDSNEEIDSHSDWEISPE
ncbi:hypothetical protein DFH08DRAFT_849021 [Mycena albidolilacea]|uniref:F-box domain-containing protein n=1 Tax=Mycena albidolilacea TaxID=1033008 RepID=A0AAD7EZH4_9AGAR|nr:hypothetical protein DFH08DRAFT_849021 [Mycena albidolilacea]